MSKILVTGVTGFMGRRTVEHLLKKGVPAGNIIGLARKMDNVANLATQGVEIRLGDYLDYNSLLRAFKGVDKVMLTSAVAFTDRFKQHLNVINAARRAGVKHLVYMAIIRKNGSERVMPEVTPSDIATEDALKASGLDYTIVYHPPLQTFYGYITATTRITTASKYRPPPAKWRPPHVMNWLKPTPKSCRRPGTKTKLTRWEAVRLYHLPT